LSNNLTNQKEDYTDRFWIWGDLRDWTQRII